MKQHAKDYLQDPVTCVLKKGDSVLSSEKTGIAPILQWIGDGMDLNGYEAADKIVGKAAAMLFVKAGVKEVYGEVMSEPARLFLKSRGIPYSYSTLTDRIINRAGNDMCPMEKTVLHIDDVEEAYAALKETLKRLRAGTF